MRPPSLFDLQGLKRMRALTGTHGQPRLQRGSVDGVSRTSGGGQPLVSEH